MELVTLPRLGQTMESGVIGKWHVAISGKVTEGELLYEVETDKTSTDVEARTDGTLVRVLADIDEEVPVGAALAVIAAPGEAPSEDDIDAFLAAAGIEAGEGTRPIPSADPGDDASPATSDAVPESPAPASGPVLAVPRARELARRRGIDLANVSGSAADGVIRVVDVLSATDTGSGPELASGPSRPHGAASVHAEVSVGGSGNGAGSLDSEVTARVPLRGVRKAMALGLAASWSQVPQFTQQVTLDASALKARLARLKFEGQAVTYNDLLVSAVAQTALEHPDVNASLRDQEIVYFGVANVAIAVATEEGLVVPVIHGAQSMTVSEIGARARELAERGRSRRLTTEDMAGGTITVSNLGVMGIDSGTPIVNSPQSAIVFVGTIKDVPVVHEGQIAIRPQLGISVSFDHRVVDGMTAAKFTSALKQRLENGG